MSIEGCSKETHDYRGVREGVAGEECRHGFQNQRSSCGSVDLFRVIRVQTLNP